MGSHPVNLALRFLLELAALASLGIWGWSQTEGNIKYLLAVGVPILAAAVWGTFAVPDDPSRSGKAPVPVPGILRLFIELLIFGSGIWALFDLGIARGGWILCSLVLIHYIVSYDRIIWLLRR